MNKRHVKFLEQFSYVIKHKRGKGNIVVDALSRRHALLSTIETKFSEMCAACEKVSQNGYNMHNGYLFKDKRLCVPKCFIRDLLVRETHEGGLMGHFRVQKTLETLHEQFYWPRIKHDVHKFCEHCTFCKKEKSKMMSHGLYTPCLYLNTLGLTFLWILS